MGKTKVLLVAALLSLAFSGLAGADYMIGDKGSEVSMLQRRLTQAGFKVDDDGVYGQSTANAVRMFQRKRHLDQDGVVGSLTYRELTDVLCLRLSRELQRRMITVIQAGESRRRIPVARRYSKPVVPMVIMEKNRRRLRRSQIQEN